MTPITLIILVAICLVIVRQFQARTLRPGPLVAIPVMLIGLGVQAFSANPPTNAGGVALFDASVVASVIVGVFRGRSERVWHTADGATWRQATSLTAGLWVASIATRVIAVLVARSIGDHSPATAQLELLLGLSFAAQHTVLALRAGLLRGLLAPTPAAN